MKVHLISKRTIEQFISIHARAKASFENWLQKIKSANWSEPNDIKKTFNSVDFLKKGSNRVVFDIAGNNYRMICKCAFGDSEVHLFVCWIGTHAEYDQLCADKKQYIINDY